MPGWYIHLDAAREAIAGLNANPNAAAIFASDGGPSATDLQALAQNNPAYFALGAIGPDIFFLLPDFKPPAGTGLWGAANLIRTLFTWWDDNFLGPYEDILGPIADNTADEIGALTGGLSEQLSGIFSQAISFLIDFVLVLITKQYDIFGLLSSGVPQGFDEQTFFWSDMLHYRKTFEFAHELWRSADTDEQKAFALGWMTHLATDVTGHCFVNEKCGGPYRLHWQRHHLVENHMDAKVYDTEHGTQPIYNMMSNSALHLWLAFNPDGTSRIDYLNFPQPGPSYDPGDDTPAQLDRKSKWDYDSDMPDELAGYLAKALKTVYNPSIAATDVGAAAAAPQIIEAITNDHTDGFATQEDIVNTYWWLYKYIKWTTTDFYKIRRPEPPDIIIVQPFPSPPGSGASDPGPGGGSDNSAWQDFLDFLLSLFAWLTYIAEVLAYPATVIAGIITSAGTAPIREVLYETLELPLYNAWLGLHWYLSMSGYLMPMQNEVNSGLNTLGVSVLDTWPGIDASLNDFSGGLGGSPTPASEPSGHDVSREFPRDVVQDPNNFVTGLINAALSKTCNGQTIGPSEFTRPWRYPLANDAGASVPIESPMSVASPYKSHQDATVLMGGSPGNNAARAAFEKAKSEGETIQLSHALIDKGTHLGDPVDYSAYVMAHLTRDHAGDADHPITNFNLDSDRGYAYRCWDWVRSKGVMGVPTPYFRGVQYDPATDPHGHRTYHAPVAPGSGWCSDDIAPPAPAGGTPSSPANTPSMQDETHERPVRIRYIDVEQRFV
jgi:hypothetical protein